MIIMAPRKSRVRWCSAFFIDINIRNQECKKNTTQTCFFFYIACCWNSVYNYLNFSNSACSVYILSPAGAGPTLLRSLADGKLLDCWEVKNWSCNFPPNTCHSFCGVFLSNETKQVEFSHTGGVNDSNKEQKYYSLHPKRHSAVNDVATKAPGVRLRRRRWKRWEQAWVWGN